MTSIVTFRWWKRFLHTYLIAPLLKVVCLRRRGACPRRRTLGNNAHRRRFQSSNFHPSWRAVTPMSNSFGKARELAGMTVWDFQLLLGSRKIPIHYDIQDYEDDVATLRGLGRL